MKNTGEEDEWKAEGVLVQRMFDNKVFITNGASMHAEQAGWFRLIFSQEDIVIKEGFKRLFEALGSRE